MNAAEARQIERSSEPEQSVLGALLIDASAIERISQILEPSDFWLNQHQLIYAAMLRLHAQGKPTDVVLVNNELNGDLQAAGGPAYLYRLSEMVPSSFHAEHYAAVVREASRRRLVVQAAELCNDTEAPVDAVIERVEGMLTDAKRRGVTPGWEPKEQAMERLYRELTGPRSEDDSGIPTGILSLDRLLRGMRPGDLHIWAARPSVGKTSLSLGVAHHVGVELGRPALFFSLEMLRKQILKKLASLDSGVPFRAIDQHTITEEQRQAFTESWNRIQAAPIDIVPAREWTMEQIRAAAREAHRRTPLSLVVVDYLQIIESSGARENRTQEIGTLTKSLKGMALELECPVIALSQLNRQSEHRPDAEPVMSDLRDGGTQEQDADVVLLLHRPEKREEAPPAVETIMAIIAKARMEQTGRVPLGFRGSLMQFAPLAIESRPAGLVDRVLHRHEEEPSWSC